MFVVVRHMQEQRAGTTAVVSSNAVTTSRRHKSHAGIKSYTVRGVAQCGFARFDRCTVLRGMRQSDTDRLEQIIADTPHESTTKTRLTCGLMVTPLDSFHTQGAQWLDTHCPQTRLHADSLLCNTQHYWVMVAYSMSPHMASLCKQGRPS